LARRRRAWFTVEGIISQTRHGRSKGRRHRHSRRCRKRAPTEGKQTGLQWERWRQAHLGDLLDGMTPMEFILRFTSTNPDLDTTIIGTINPAHLQANLDILQQGQGISFAAILVNTTPEYATIRLSPSGGRSHTRSVELQRDTKISRFLLARNRKFESISLQRGVHCEPGAIRSVSYPVRHRPLCAADCAFRAGSDRLLGAIC
jgi:hypothetical protein